MYKPENIKDLIKLNEAPYFTLKAKDNPYKPERYLFSNKKVKDMDVEKALKMFDQQLEMHSASPDQIFIIELSSSASGAPGSGILGPFDFQLNGAKTSIPGSGGSSMNGLGGIDMEMQSAMGNLGAMYAKRDELIREQGKLDMERALFERDKEDFKAQKVKEMAELSGLREKFESNSERIKHGAEKAFMKLYDVFMESTDSKEEPIGAVVVEEPATPEEKAIEAIGEEILEALDAGKINMNTIEQISAAVKQILNNL